MTPLSAIDKKIIYELGRDARQSYREIARNTKSKKEAVAYHLAQLLDKKIITKFVPVFSLTRLGIYSFKIYLKLHGVSDAAEHKLFDALVKNPEVIWLAKAVGQWDLLLGFYSTDIVSFAQLKNQILAQFSSYVEDYEITMIEDALVFNRDYLIEKKLEYRKRFVFGGEQKRIILRDDELQLLSQIRNDGRFQIRTVAEKLDEDPRTTLAKIKKLEKEGVIQGYTTFVDLPKIGYQLHKLCLYLSTFDDAAIKKIIAFVTNNPFVVHIIRSLGSWELEIEIEAENIQEVYEYIRELKTHFPQEIKRIDSVTITEEAKLEFFPERI